MLGPATRSRPTETLARKTRRKRSRFRSLVLAGLLVLAVLAPAGPVDAAENETCWSPSIKVKWIGSWGTEKSTAMSGFRVWVWDVDTYAGSEPVSISETSGSKTVGVQWTPLVGADGYGICDTGVIGFNSLRKKEILADTDYFRRLAAHEMGHVIGLDHVGKQDSYGGDNPPVMWGCWSTNYRLSQDDHASMQMHTDQAGAYKSVTANSSFEEDTVSNGDYPFYREFWYVSSGAGTWRFSGGVDGTPYYMAFGRTGGSSYIFSTTALTDSPTIDWVKARANYRKFESDDYGNVKVMLRVRPYDSGGSPCGIPSRKDGSHSYGSASYYTKYCTPGLGWGYCTTSGQDPPHKAVTSGGIEVRVYVYNYMKSGNGDYRSVGVDRVRVLANY